MRPLKNATVVIPTYNRADYLSLTLESIKLQRPSPYTFEVVVVDDGSSDHTRQVIDEYSDEFDLIYLFQEDRGNRTGEARNLGISHASGEIIIFIDCGMVLRSDCIKEHMDVRIGLEKDIAVIGYAYGFDQYCDNPKSLISHIKMGDIDGSMAILDGLRSFLDMRDSVYSEWNFEINRMPAPWAFFITCNCSVSRNVLNLIGGFDTNLDLNWGVEDLELGYRLWKNSIPFVVARSAKAIHYPHDADMKEKFNEERTNKLYFHNKHKCLATKLFLNCNFIELNRKILSAKNYPVSI